LELSDLKVFKQVVESGGIIKAAEKLNRVPSNVSMRIKKLEDELGKSLFIREKNRLRISNEGEQLLLYSHKILALAQQAIDELNNEQTKGTLTIGAMEAVAATKLANPLTLFHQSHPHIELNLTTGASGILIDKVLAGELDMAFVADPTPDTRLNINEIFKEDLVLVSALSHKKIKSPNDLENEPTLLGFNHRCAYRTRLTQWLAQAGRASNVIEISSYHALLSCIAAGMGVGIVPSSLLELYPFKENLKTHTLPSKWRKCNTAIIWRHDSVTSSMRIFAESC